MVLLAGSENSLVGGFTADRGFPTFSHERFHVLVLAVVTFFTLVFPVFPPPHSGTLAELAAASDTSAIHTPERSDEAAAETLRTAHDPGVDRPFVPHVAGPTEPNAQAMEVPFLIEPRLRDFAETPPREPPSSLRPAFPAPHRKRERGVPCEIRVRLCTSQRS